MRSQAEIHAISADVHRKSKGRYLVAHSESHAEHHMLSGTSANHPELRARVHLPHALSHDAAVAHVRHEMARQRFEHLFMTQIEPVE